MDRVTTYLINFLQQRISTYASTPQEKLNEDQKRTLKTLPGLEAVHKELEEVKKAIEVLCKVSFHLIKSLTHL